MPHYLPGSRIASVGASLVTHQALPSSLCIMLRSEGAGGVAGEVSGALTVIYTESQLTVGKPFVNMSSEN